MKWLFLAEYKKQKKGYGFTKYLNKINHRELILDGAKGDFTDLV